MKLLAAAIPVIAVSAFLVGVRAETPWFAVKPADSVSFASSSTTLNPGQSLAIASVPSNKKLVLTDINVQQVGGGGNFTLIELEERDAAGNVTLKVPETVLSSMFVYGRISHSDGHGVVFAAGADAVLKLNLSASGPCTIVYFVNGYLTDK